MKVIFESLNGASGSVLVGVLNSLWQAVAVALVAWLALKLTPRINAATRFVVWWAVLAVITVLPIAGRLLTVAVEIRSHRLGAGKFSGVVGSVDRGASNRSYSGNDLARSAATH